MSEVSSKEDGIEVRIVVPRDALPTAPRPDYYSQQNCELLGLTKRTFLELLRRPGAPRVTKVGKLRLVRREDILSFLERLAEQQKDTPDEGVDGPDQVLMELGCVPRGSRG